MAQLYTEISGSGDDLLVLLHGLGASADIWSPMIASRPANWSGRIMAIDLPGHGGSPQLDRYDIPLVAASVAEAIRGQLPGAGFYRVLGHSYGGVVALALAGAATGRAPDFVYGLGIKTVWAEAELESLHRLAQKPPRLFADRQSAEDWYLKVCGLAGLGVPAPACAGRGVVATDDGQWRLALDARVNAITAPDMAALTRKLAGRFALAYGADDTMVDTEDLSRIDPAVRSLAGGGHNIMVNNPGAVWAWLS